MNQKQRPPQRVERDCSSPPCYAHEIDPAYMGVSPEPPADPSGEREEAPRNPQQDADETATEGPRSRP